MREENFGFLSARAITDVFAINKTKRLKSVLLSYQNPCGMSKSCSLSTYVRIMLYMYDLTKNKFYNEDCVRGCKKYIEDNSVDLIITDPPYGIDGDKLHKHYNRDEQFVIDGYIEIPKTEYANFSMQWIKEAERILRPGGSIYIVSGYTNLIDVLNALKQTSLKEVNHLIWKYNFGVHTTKKFVSSHYHILFLEKSGGQRTFNTYTRYGQSEKHHDGGSLNYQDREDVWIINREYKPGEVKNKNELPKELLIKLLQYSSNQGDVVCDLFLGSFSTAKTAIGLSRYAIGFEMNPKGFAYQVKQVQNVVPGSMLPLLRMPVGDIPQNYGKSWTNKDISLCRRQFQEAYNKLQNKKKSIERVALEMGRGYFSVLNILDQNNIELSKESTLQRKLIL